MPVNFVQAERTQLLQFLNFGIGNAVNAPAIAAHMGSVPANQTNRNILPY
jgi:hypothetical protein